MQNSDILSFTKFQSPLPRHNYHSIDLTKTAMRGTPFDLAIYDEAHRTAGNASSFYAQGLTDVGLPALRRLFLTATPRNFVRAESGGAAINSMDNEDVYGPVVYRLGYEDAISQGVIVPLVPLSR